MVKKDLYVWQAVHDKRVRHFFNDVALVGLELDDPKQPPLIVTKPGRCIVVPLSTQLENLDEIERLTDAEREARLKQALTDLDQQRKDAQ
jgi:hypothetical protein